MNADPSDAPAAPSAAAPSPAPSAAPGATSRPHPPAYPTGARLLILSLTAIGVVYGDIGTSVLYAVKECFGPAYGVPPTRGNIFGVMSLIFWALTLVVSVKYISFILRADNRGEGGVLALLALVQQRMHRRGDRVRYATLVALGLFGSALLYGDGVITPAISVLGAMEGLSVATPALEPYIVPAALVIIIALFSVQRHGTGRVGVVFGPVTLVWFVTIAILGVRAIAEHPDILLAVNPWYSMQFFLDHPAQSFVLLGAIVLVITGGEALYADMGHFGRRPIRLAWFGLAFPALLLNYFGQGALLLSDPTAVDNPFYRLVPPALLYPMVALATAAAVIASQALISGAFSLTRQAMQLGYVPRVTVTHTSAREAGQIYIREVNIALMVLCIMLVLFFGSSSRLAGMYGVAVTGTMAITTVLFYEIARRRFQWPRRWAVAFLAVFLAIDLAFFGANLLKILEGGWFPLGVAAVIYLLMTTWKRGREYLHAILQRSSLPLDLFLADIARTPPPRVRGTAVFMTSDPVGAPVVLLHHVKHNKVLHDQVLLLSVLSAEIPEVDDDQRVEVLPLGQGFYRVIARYGFMEAPNIPEILELCARQGLHTRTIETSFYLGRERLIPTRKAALEALPGDDTPPPKPMRTWRKRAFSVMSRNARGATEFFGIPPNRVVELGAQIEF
jgi:KUP system potassium uptake protein